MVFVYILINDQKKFYIGITKLEPAQRLKRHNNGDIYSTKFGKPWKLLKTEKYQNYQEARKREMQIKSWKNGNAFKKFIFKSAGWSNGRTADSESAYLGSNPSPADLKINHKLAG